jgi:uncharacterized protein YidB (DUF937 family)
LLDSHAAKEHKKGDPVTLMNQIMGAIGMDQNHPDARQHQDLMSNLAGMLNQPGGGGVGGLLAKLESGGLGGAVQSWLGSGQNQPVSPDQIRGALGDDQIRQLASNAGVSPQQASSGLAALLPALVDKLSPNGQLHDEGTLSRMLGAFMHHGSNQPPQ